MDLVFDAIYWKLTGLELSPRIPSLPVAGTQYVRFGIPHLTGTGRDVLPIVGNVLLTVGYGTDGSEFIGTLPSGVTYPATPTLVMLPQTNGTQVIATISGADALTINSIYVLRVGTFSYYLLGTITGNGSATYTPGAVGEYRSYVISQNASGGRSANAGQDFWLSNNTTTRNRIRDDSARAFLRAAQRHGKQVSYQNPGEAAVIIWAIIGQKREVSQAREGRTDTRTITITIPRQTSFPTSGGVLWGATLTINADQYQVDDVQADNEDIEQASAWTLRCGKFGSENY